MLESEFEREVQRVGRGWTEPPPAAPPLPAPMPTAVTPVPAEEGAPKGQGQGTSQSATAAAAAAEKRKIGHGVELTEWEREGWTYHAKGEAFLLLGEPRAGFIGPLLTQRDPSRRLALTLSKATPAPHAHRLVEFVDPVSDTRPRDVLLPNDNLARAPAVDGQ